MSDQAPGKVDMESDNKQEKQSDLKQKLNKNQEDEEEDEGYSCKKCWGGYCECFVAMCRVIIKNKPFRVSTIAS